ncbi:MAG: hypothetical protein IPN46_17040 [Saprospiraceae bacterium]|nr:hypothetical protein [Saprospiraceae bacterium]
MNVWSTKAETYSTTETAKVGGYQFPMKRITLNMLERLRHLSLQVVVNTSGTTNTSDFGRKALLCW